VSLNSNNISISFTVKALEDGKVNDIIRVEKSNGKRLRVRVIGKNKAEMI
jgi:flagella basal body P-ring formation protein FlgA